MLAPDGGSTPGDPLMPDPAADRPAPPLVQIHTGDWIDPRLHLVVEAKTGLEMPGAYNLSPYVDVIESGGRLYRADYGDYSRALEVRDELAAKINEARRAND
jgi:hypothetical protein